MSETTELPELLTLEEVAKRTRTTVETVRYWRRHGQGPRGFRLGRRVVYDAAEVAAWIAERRAHAESSK